MPTEVENRDISCATKNRTKKELNIHSTFFSDESLLSDVSVNLLHSAQSFFFKGNDYLPCSE